MAVHNNLSPIWADIQKSIPIRGASSILENISFALSSGDRIKFWHDKWLGKIPIKFIFSILFNLSSDQNVVMGDLGYWDNGTWIWKFFWRPNLWSGSLLLRVICLLPLVM